MRLSPLVAGAFILCGALVASPAELSEQDAAAGKKIYVTKCARCHKFYDPAKYGEEDWNNWMEKMRQKARLKDDQYTLLSSYLQSLRPAKSAQTQEDTTK